MRWQTVAAGVLAVTAMSAIAGAQTVQTFEDFSPCDNTTGNVGVYGAVNYLTQWTCYAFSQPPFNPHSGTNRVYASNGASNSNSASFSFGATSFSGAWFSGLATVNFQLFFMGSPVATSGPLVTTATPTFLSSGYNGLVDRVTVNGTDVNWVMDDVTFGTAVTTSPEPASIALVGSGMLAIGVFVRRRRRANE